MYNKLILITGGSSGIGKAAAKLLHNNGARIILQARNLDKLKSAANQIDSSGNRVSYYSTDLADQKSVLSSAEQIIDNEGVPDVIINCAGAGEWLSFKESEISHYKQTIDSPYLATALTCKVFFDKMQKRASGHFIIINSAAAYFSFPGATGYIPARYAMLGFSRALQADLHNSDFKVSMIALGKVDTTYFINNPISEDRIPKISDWLIPTLSVEAAGEIVKKVVESKKPIVIKPFILSALVLLNRFFPRLFRWVMRITSQG
ncbi:MAG: hypothetical protein C0598_06040 [Marinilabiliales bacterium]|nr:MAG: hypothetical protein C0598_06040 [Marinilabiliales bacterium]